MDWRRESMPLVEWGTLGPGQHLPLVLRPARAGLDLFDWVAGNRDAVEPLLSRHGGILFRGFDLGVEADLARFAAAASMPLVPYLDRATPRTDFGGNVYSATDYPPLQSIFLHNESSFARRWPLVLFFLCLTPAREGGETPVADVRGVFRRIPSAIRETFMRKQVMYVRNFGRGMGLAWPDVFQTEDRSEVERFCRGADIALEWLGADRLRTRQVRPAAARHCRTGEMVWFNHAAVLHVSTLEPTRRRMLLKMFEEQDLPNNTYYGDGSPIEPAVLDALRDAYEQESVSLQWQRGDLLMLDNMLVAHGRKPFRGPRKIVVGLAEPRSWDEVETGCPVPAVGA